MAPVKNNKEMQYHFGDLFEDLENFDYFRHIITYCLQDKDWLNWIRTLTGKNGFSWGMNTPEKRTKAGALLQRILQQPFVDRMSIDEKLEVENCLQMLIPDEHGLKRTSFKSETQQAYRSFVYDDEERRKKNRERMRKARAARTNQN